MQLNHIQAFGAPDTTAVLFVVGYELEANSEPDQRQRGVPRTTNVTNYEVIVMLGGTILNSYASETSVAESVEYRRGLWRYVDVTASYVHESGHVQSRRDSERWPRKFGHINGTCANLAEGVTTYSRTLA